MAFRSVSQSREDSRSKDNQDVRRYYESKIPMGRGCTVKDILAAIYYIIEQQYETGQAIPVTGGQIMREPAFFIICCMLLVTFFSLKTPGGR